MVGSDVRWCVTTRILADRNLSQAGSLMRVTLETSRRSPPNSTTRAVDTLVILGTNPGYHAPGDLDFANAVRKRRMSLF